MSKGKVTVGCTANGTPPFDNALRAARLSEEQGFDALWFYDHLMNFWPQSIWTPDLVPAAKWQRSPHVNLDVIASMGAVGVSTERIKLGTAVTEAARRPAAVLAQDFLTLDHITKGRVILGIGSGEALNAAPYGIDCRKPVSRLEEALKIIRLLWENDQPVDFDGQFWKLKGAIMPLGPYQPGVYPPIWVGAAGPRSLDITGRLADGWIPIAQPLDEYRLSMAIIEEAAASAGRPQGSVTYGMLAYLVTDDDHERCHLMLDSLLIKGLCLQLGPSVFARHGVEHPLRQKAQHGLLGYVPSLMSREETLSAIKAVPFSVAHEFIMHGTPDDLVTHVAPYVAAGLSHIAMANVTFAADDTKLRSSFKLAAEAVAGLKVLA